VIISPVTVSRDITGRDINPAVVCSKDHLRGLKNKTKGYGITLYTEIYHSLSIFHLQLHLQLLEVPSLLNQQ
jgi:hypothetical protein